MYSTAWKKRDLVEHRSQQHVCPVPCRAAGRSSSAGREVSGQYPAMLLPTKIPVFENRVFSMAVPSFVLAHTRRVEGSVYSTDDFPIQAPALCWGRCRIRDFSPTAAG